MSEKKAPWLDATEAVALLGVNHATLYAYVSRGHIRSEPLPGGSRRRYSRDDIERLVDRASERRNPEKVAERALHLGMPVLESAITLIANERLYYRGCDVCELARTRSVSEVAELLWGIADVDASESPTRVPRPVAHLRRKLPFIALAQSALALTGADDALAHDLRSHAVAQAGWRIVWQLVGVVVGASSVRDTIDATLARGWGVESDVDLIRAALILCADHELNVSTFAVRCAASAGASPYGAVIAGLATLEGTKHGGTTRRIEATWAALRATRDIERELAERVRRDDRIDGFGHRLYPHGDPRAKVLLESLPAGKATRFARKLAHAASSVLSEEPTIDFALVAMARSIGLPPAAPLTLFAIGRTLGWVAHAIEQYEKDAIIRPRARYVGRLPAPKIEGSAGIPHPRR